MIEWKSSGEWPKYQLFAHNRDKLFIMLETPWFGFMAMVYSPTLTRRFRDFRFRIFHRWVFTLEWKCYRVTPYPELSSQG